MRRHRFDPIHGVVALLLTGSIHACSETTRYVTTVSTATYQKPIDACAADNRHETCVQLCREVFKEEGTYANCGFKRDGEKTDVWYEVTRTAEEAQAAKRDEEARGCAGGRRPAGLACMPLLTGTVAGVYLAWCAQMEAASIIAFARVHDNLVALGAPEELLARVRRAADDELAHAQIAVALARRYGVEPIAPSIAPEGNVAVVDRAIENAVEGCVGEAVAAIEAAFIAAASPDAAVRDAFARIAADEATHALLSYDVAATYAQHLTGDERARVSAAFRAAASHRVTIGITPGLASLGVTDAARLRETVAGVLANLAPRFDLAHAA